MARTSREKTKYPYGGGRVVGSLAYDYDYEERRQPRTAPQPKAEPERRSAPPPAPRRRERAEERPRVRERQRISPTLAVGAAALAVMIVLMVMSYAQLTSLSTQVVSMQQELKTLDAENVALLTQYERTFDLETIKAAAAAAGMNKPSASQVSYIDLSAPDSVELCETQSVSVLSRIFTSLGQSARGVVEYFS